MNSRGVWLRVREGAPKEFWLNRYRLALTISTLLMFLLGFAAGRLFTIRQLAAANEVKTPATTVTNLAAGQTLPLYDVPGTDVDRLPRYPGATRVEYRQEMVNNLVETEVEYVVAADLESVHDFYRIVFDEEGWSVVDLGVHQGEWTFFIISGSQEALVELEAREALVEIEIEISEPPVGD